MIGASENKRKTQNQKTKKTKNSTVGGVGENHTNKSNNQIHEGGVGKQTQKQNTTKKSMMGPKRNT